MSSQSPARFFKRSPLTIHCSPLNPYVSPHLKVSLRNLLKYKLQNAISILALAVGMVTLAATHFVLMHFGNPAICDGAVPAELALGYVLSAQLGRAPHNPNPTFSSPPRHQDGTYPPHNLKTS